MRRFFRFSVRDLLWLTLVVAVGLGWFVRERSWLVREQQLRAEVDAASSKATEWRMAAGGLEQFVTRQGWTVGWDFMSRGVYVVIRNGNDFAPFAEPRRIIKGPKT